MLIPSFAPTGPARGPVFLMSVRESRVAVLEVEAGRVSDALFVGTVYERQCWAIDAEASADITDFDDTAASAGGGAPDEHVDLMTLFGSVDEATWLAAGRAVQLIEWQRNHRFCGRCGTPTAESENDRSRRCPACGLLAYPRLSPAVIMLIERDDGRALLARNAKWPAGRYSCLAGFVEPGETVESALRREVAEEVGIQVGTLRYFGSQPWPFPHSLMLGFHADYAGGDIECDGEEIAEADWFTPGGLPAIPGRISIARRLIDDWVARTA